jgi:hypothetical protein
VFRSNYGNYTQDFTQYMYNSHARPIPGKEFEKVIQMYIIERRTEGPIASSDRYNSQTHTLQEITLVKTAEFTTTSARATATRRPSADRDDDDGPSISGGKLAAIIVPILILIIAWAIFCCCKGCCYSKEKKRRLAAQRNLPMAEQQQMEEGSENGDASQRTGPIVGDGPGQVPTLDPAAQRPRVEERDALPRYERDAPPKYTP